VGLNREEAMDRSMEILKMLKIDNLRDRPTYMLSGGEKKRVAIAGILAMTPEILVLDEPTTYLDPPGQRALADLLTHLPQAKILVTHDVSLARSICSRAVFFQGGTIVAEGSVEDIVSRFGWNVALDRSKWSR